MKKILSLVLLALVLVGCSSPTDEKYAPVVIDDAGVLSDSLRQLFVNFDYPAGVVPVLVAEPAIDDLLKTGARADDVFDDIGDQRATVKFGRFGLLVMVTAEPRLMQLRMGSYFDTYGELCGVTMGQRYLDVQQRFTDEHSDMALHDLLTMACSNMQQRKELSWYQRQQLSSLHSAINSAMEWFGTPSKNFYGTVVSKPLYVCISYGNRVFGSWLWGIVLAFVVVLAGRWLLVRALESVIPKPSVRQAVTGIFSAVFGWVYSLAAAGCAMLLSSGRLEDLTAIKAFGVPNVEAFIADPSMFVQENNFWLAALFFVLTDLSLILTNSHFINSLLPRPVQKHMWESISEEQRDFILNMAQVYEVKPDETPYEALADKRMERNAFIAGPLVVGALFFFPKAVLWTGIAYAITKILASSRSYVNVYKANARERSMDHLVGRLGGSVIGLVVGAAFSLGLNWLIDPFDNRSGGDQEQVAQTELAAVEEAGEEVPAGTARMQAAEVEPMPEQEVPAFTETAEAPKLADAVEAPEPAKPVEHAVARERSSATSQPAEKSSQPTAEERAEPAQKTGYRLELPTDNGDRVFDVVEQMPQFPGGQSALMNFLSRNTHYPPQAEASGIQGRVVLTFIVERNGAVSNIRIAKSVHPLLDREAVRVASGMPRWQPGMQNGVPVRVRYTLPLTFRL